MLEAEDSREDERLEKKTSDDQRPPAKCRCLWDQPELDREGNQEAREEKLLLWQWGSVVTW